MKTRNLALAAIGLWVVSAAAVAVLFVRGQTHPTADGRQAITLAPGERDLILKEMRGMLDSVRGVVAGLTDGKGKEVAQAARASGTATVGAVPPALMAKLPLSFKSLGMKTHGTFDSLAVAAEQGEPQDLLLSRLSDQLSNCVACHAAFRLESNTPAQR